VPLRKSPDERVSGWVVQLERITQQIYSLHHYRALWRRLAEITQATNLPFSVFFDALPIWYVHTQGVGVRRQLDTTKGTVSLLRLLEDIERHPGTMTRQRHVALWVGDDPQPVINEADGWSWTPFLDEAHANFDRFSGGRERDVISKEVIRSDIEAIKSAGRLVTDYVNDAVAHTTLRPERQVPTYADLNEAIDKLAELVNKYTSYLKASTIMQFEPIIQGPDWTAIFRVPWIQPGDA
jgi:hypothetical protein